MGCAGSTGKSKENHLVAALPKRSSTRTGALSSPCWFESRSACIWPGCAKRDGCRLQLLLLLFTRLDIRSPSLSTPPAYTCPNTRRTVCEGVDRTGRNRSPVSARRPPCGMCPVCRQRVSASSRPAPRAPPIPARPVRACAPVRRLISGPKSPASTSGPHITAKRLGLSASASLRRVLGITTSTVSPGFPCPRNFDVGIRRSRPFSITLPLTLTPNPSPAQNGRRSASVNFFDACGVILMVAVCPMGRSVATSSLTPADFQSAMEGAYRFTQSLALLRCLGIRSKVRRRAAHGSPSPNPRSM